MSNDSVHLTQAELRTALDEQLRFLHSSCVAFDQGDVIEAKRIAVQLRILWHDTNRSQSLLGQLGLKSKGLDTSFLVPAAIAYTDYPNSSSDERRLFRFGGPRLAPVFCSPPASMTLLPFDQWWQGVVLSDGDGQLFTRKQLVTTVADKDGGAHVDPSLNRPYYDLTRQGNSTLMLLEPTGDGTTYRSVQTTPSPVAVTLRQIGHETLKTICKDYHYDGNRFYPGPQIAYFQGIIEPDEPTKS